MASILRMPTTISPGQWQPWTAVSPLLGLISMAAVRWKTLYCRGECKSAILAYMASVRREREGELFFLPSIPSPLCTYQASFTPWKGIRILECGKFLREGSEIQKILHVESGILLWSPEDSLRNPLTIKIQNPSSSDRDWNPVPGILKSVTAWNRES